jgi:hypothetical protein
MLTCEGPEGAQQLYCPWQATLPYAKCSGAPTQDGGHVHFIMTQTVIRQQPRPYRAT